MATSTVVFAALHGKTFNFWLWRSKSTKPVVVRAGGQLSLSPRVLLLNKTHVHAVAKELDRGGKASCHLLFSILVLLYSSEGSTFSPA